MQQLSGRWAATRAPLIALLAVSLLHCQRGVRYDLRDAELAAIVDGEPITTAAVALLFQPYERAGTLTQSEFIHRVVQNRLIHRKFGGPADEADPGAMPSDDQLRAQLQYEQFAALLLDTQATGSAKSVAAIVADSTVSRHLPSEEQNQALYKPGYQVGQPRPLAVEKELNRERASAYTLATYRLPGDSQTRDLSYFDVYRGARQVVREELAKANPKALQTQIDIAIRRRYLDRVGDDADHPQHQVLADIRAIIADERAAQAHQLAMGFRRHEHDDGALGERAKRITDDRIRAYYRANQAEFTELAEVRCRHIQLDDQASAQAAYSELQAGADFVAMVEKHSTAPDRDAAEPGLLPPIRSRHADSQPPGKRPFVHTLCLLHARDPQPTPPLRTREGFEILSVEDVRDGYQPIDEPTVRAKISRHLAAQDLVAERDRLLASLMKQASVRINPALTSEAAP
ncbi:MAG: hypothetical protein Tsb0020_06270 [Haliangiales bacterium]